MRRIKTENNLRHLKGVLLHTQTRTGSGWLLPVLILNDIIKPLKFHFTSHAHAHAHAFTSVISNLFPSVQIQKHLTYIHTYISLCI